MVEILYGRSYHNLNIIRIWPKTTFFEGLSWFKFNDFGLELGMTMKIYSVAKVLKLRVRKILGIVPTFVEVTAKKLVWGVLLLTPTSWIRLILNMIWFFILFMYILIKGLTVFSPCFSNIYIYIYIYIYIQYNLEYLI